MGAIELSQKYFSRSSFDLIYARMDQTALQWEAELKQALGMVAAGHLSLYQLTIEPDTAFYNAHRRGKLILPDENLSAEFYDLTGDICADAGLPSYETSNYAKAGEESRHNLIYWNYGDYLGVGAGAHSRVTYEGKTYAGSQYKKPEKYIMAVDSQSHASEYYDLLDRQMMAEEMIMMGLRLRRGVLYADFEARIGKSLSDFIDRNIILGLQDEGFIAQDSLALRLSAKGAPLLNHILGKILA
jgi:oxygen-independent coproporphyrinogen-3 oxidase